MNQIETAPSHHAIGLRLVQAFGFIVAVLGLCSALAAGADLMFDEVEWGMTWIVIPIGIAVALAGLAFAWLAQRIWDIVHYFASL